MPHIHLTICYTSVTDKKQPGKSHHLAQLIHKRGARVYRLLFNAMLIRDFNPWQGEK